MSSIDEDRVWPEMITATQNILKMLINDHLDVPFIYTYREDTFANIWNSACKF